MDAELIGGQTPFLARGPYLQMDNSSAITLRWRTNIPSDSQVRYGNAPGNLSNTATDPRVTTEHEIRLTGLQPETTYFYAIGSTVASLTTGEANTFFRTTPAPGANRPTRIWVLGDCGTANSNQFAVRDGYYNSPQYRFNDLILLLGDNAYNIGADTEYQAAIFDMYGAILRQSPLWSCLGNHDVAQATSGSYTNPYFDIFTFPTNAEAGGYPSSTERYFSWDRGDIHFVSLDSQTNDASSRAAMVTWLQNDLAANTRRWLIAVWHHPPYTKGTHDSDSEEQLIWTRNNLVPLLENYGVDLVLTGHSHVYERSYFLDGYYGADHDSRNVEPHKRNAGDGRPGSGGAYTKERGAHLGAVYAVTGSAGQTGGPLGPKLPPFFLALSEIGSMVLDISGNRLDATFLGPGPNAQVRDTFTITKGAPVPATPAFFNGQVPLSNGVFFLRFPNGAPFGFYSFLADPNFIFHFDLGYEYVFDAGNAQNGVFLYDFASQSFFYTSPVFPFPYLYDFSLNAVLYYFPDPNNPDRYNTNGTRFFYNYATGQIIVK